MRNIVFLETKNCMKCVLFVSIKNLIFSVLGNQPLAHLFSDQASTKSGYRHLSNPEIAYLSTRDETPFPHILIYAKKEKLISNII